MACTLVFQCTLCFPPPAFCSYRHHPLVCLGFCVVPGILPPLLVESAQRLSQQQSTPLPLDHPLVNPFHNWATRGQPPRLYSSENSSSSSDSTGNTTPTCTNTLPKLPAPPAPPSPDPPTCRRRHSPSHIKRPMNPFMLFRSDFCKGQKISPSIEHDHRHISRIAANVWRRLPIGEKQLWMAKAEQIKAEHRRQYPGYRFAPTPRVQKPLKRKVKRNGPEDMARCDKVAELLLAGKKGHELEAELEADPAISVLSNSNADESSDRASPERSTTSFNHGRNTLHSPTVHDWNPTAFNTESFESPPFRSPLLPPLAFTNRSPTPIPPSYATEGYHNVRNSMIQS
jgi:hypothetical protein